MKRSPGPRKTANLSESVRHRLDMYAIAAQRDLALKQKNDQHTPKAS